MSNLPRIGTAGWSYPHWSGIVYPTSRQAAHPLELLARQFDVVEINSSFYQPLKPEIVKLWIKKVQSNPQFRFTAKLHQRFTHARILEDAEIDEFKEGLRPLLRAGKLGALLMQFPWSFRFTAENREFFIRLRRAFSEFPLVAEMRHEQLDGGGSGGHVSRLSRRLLQHRPAGIHARDAADCFSDFRSAMFGCMAGIRRIRWAIPERREIASTIICIQRPSSPNGSTGSTIGRYAESTFVIFNNDAAAKSVVNALQLRAMLTGEFPAAPRDLRRKYPVELQNFGPRQAEQQILFPTGFCSLNRTIQNPQALVRTG